MAISSTSLIRASRNRQLLSKARGKEVGKKEVQEKERKYCWNELTVDGSSAAARMEVVLVLLVGD